MPYRKIWIEPGTGVSYLRIPCKWRGICNLTQELAIRKGWRARVVSDIPDICTKYQFIAAIKQVSDELWKKLYQAYQTDLEFSFYWNSVNQLDRNDTTFQYLASRLGAVQDDIDAVFEAAAGVAREEGKAAVEDTTQEEDTPQEEET